MMRGFNPAGFRSDLRGLQVPLLLLVGDQDEAFIAPQFEPVIRPLVSHAVIEQLESVGHLDLVTSPVASSKMIAWLQTI